MKKNGYFFLQVKDIKEANIVKAVPTQNNGYPELVILDHVEVIQPLSDIYKYIYSYKSVKWLGFACRDNHLENKK